MRLSHLILGLSLLCLPGCLASPLDGVATGYNAILNEVSGQAASADQLPTSGSATYDGYLLMSAYDQGAGQADFIGEAQLDATFDAGGGAIAGQADGFVDAETDERVAGTIVLANGRLDRTATLAHPEGNGQTGSLLIDADGTLTPEAGDAYAFDTEIFGDVVGPDAGYLTGQVHGTATSGGTAYRAGGTLAAGRD